MTDAANPENSVVARTPEVGPDWRHIFSNTVILGCPCKQCDRRAIGAFLNELRDSRELEDSEADSSNGPKT